MHFFVLFCFAGFAQAPTDSTQVVVPGRTNAPAQEQNLM